jgi:hypothetical protein
MIYKRSQPRSRIIRGLFTLWAGTFLFFHIYTAPHRVHHFFDRVEPVSHASAGDHHRNSKLPNQLPSDADCVFQASANRCADSITAELQSFVTIWRFQTIFVPLDHQYPHLFISAPLHSRAPPVA